MGVSGVTSLKCANKVYLFKWRTVRRDSQASMWGHHGFNVTPAMFILATLTRSQRCWRFCTFTMSNKVTEVLGLERSLFGFLIYCSFNRNSGKALSAVIWFKFHCPFCISPNSLTSDSLVSCCASLRAVDILICGFCNKILAPIQRKGKNYKRKRAPQILNWPAAHVHHTTWKWLPILGIFKKSGELVPWSSLDMYTVPQIIASDFFIEEKIDEE